METDERAFGYSGQMLAGLDNLNAQLQVPMDYSRDFLDHLRKEHAWLSERIKHMEKLIEALTSNPDLAASANAVATVKRLF